MNISGKKGKAVIKQFDQYLAALGKNRPSELRITMQQAHDIQWHPGDEYQGVEIVVNVINWR